MEWRHSSKEVRVKVGNCIEFGYRTSKTFLSNAADKHRRPFTASPVFSILRFFRGLIITVGTFYVLQELVTVQYMGFRRLPSDQILLLAFLCLYVYNWMGLSKP